MTKKEIAEVINISIHKLAKQLGVSRATVRYRKRRALMKLKKII